MVKIEPNINWLTGGTGAAKSNEVVVTANAAFTAYALNTVSASTNAFSYVRDYQAKTTRCKNAGTAPVGTATGAACTGGTW